jgi:1,4-dihydroxy-6-naphthoate synthase
MKLNLSFSPCPNDTFMFEALVNNRINREGIEFSILLNDIEELNKKAIEGLADVTKISVAAYPKLSRYYQILSSGSALGDHNGPILISKEHFMHQDVPGLTIAIPGYNTTANLLLSIAFPGAGKKIEYLFSDIESAVLKGETEAGLIIHEGRFTYEGKGLLKIIDLGEYWQENFHKPVPLGLIVIKRNLPDRVKKIMNRLIRKSIEYAYQNPYASESFIKEQAQEMDDDVIQQHIDLYVTQYSVNLGSAGKDALDFFYTKAREHNLISELTQPIYT